MPITLPVAATADDRAFKRIADRYEKWGSDTGKKVGSEMAKSMGDALEKRTRSRRISLSGRTARSRTPLARFVSKRRSCKTSAARAPRTRGFSRRLRRWSRRGVPMLPPHGMRPALTVNCTPARRSCRRLRRCCRGRCRAPGSGSWLFRRSSSPRVRQGRVLRSVVLSRRSRVSRLVRSQRRKPCMTWVHVGIPVADGITARTGKVGDELDAVMDQVGMCGRYRGTHRSYRDVAAQVSQAMHLTGTIWVR